VNGYHLRELYDQQVRALERHPSLGKAAFHAKVALLDDLRCESRAATHVTRIDAPKADGGTGTAPTPGDLMRASLGACLAMDCRLWAARLDVEIQDVEITLTSELDLRGQLGIDDDVPVGWQRLLLDIRIVSNAPPADVRRVVEHADRLNPMFANLSSSITRIYSLTIEKLPLTPL
jgi:uncharacterized OsmC-like protein